MDAVLDFKGAETGGQPAPLPELASVRILAPAEESGHVLPIGSIGTIVFVYNEGEAYEVEFYDGDYWLATLAAADVEPFGAPVEAG